MALDTAFRFASTAELCQDSGGMCLLHCGLKNTLYLALGNQQCPRWLEDAGSGPCLVAPVLGEEVSLLCVNLLCYLRVLLESLHKRKRAAAGSWIRAAGYLKTEQAQHMVRALGYIQTEQPQHMVQGFQVQKNRAVTVHGIGILGYTEAEQPWFKVRAFT